MWKLLGKGEISPQWNFFPKYSQTAAKKLKRKQKPFFKRHGYQDVARQWGVEFVAYVIRKYIKAGGDKDGPVKAERDIPQQNFV